MLFINSTSSTALEADYSVGALQTNSTTPCSPSIYSAFLGGIHADQSEQSANYKVHYVRFQETRGELLPHEFIRFFEKRDILTAAKAAIESIENADVKNAARLVANCISGEMDKQENISSFPPLYGFSADDGSFLIEWIFENFRIGFNVERDGNQSSWYLVSRANVGGINASGYLQGISLQAIVTWLVGFASTQVTR